MSFRGGKPIILLGFISMLISICEKLHFAFISKILRKISRVLYQYLLFVNDFDILNRHFPLEFSL